MTYITKKQNNSVYIHKINFLACDDNLTQLNILSWALKMFKALHDKGNVGN